MYERTA